MHDYTFISNTDEDSREKYKSMRKYILPDDLAFIASELSTKNTDVIMTKTLTMFNIPFKMTFTALLMSLLLYLVFISLKLEYKGNGKIL